MLFSPFFHVQRQGKSFKNPNTISHTEELTGSLTAEKWRRQRTLWNTLRARTNPPPKQRITCPQSATKPTQTKTKKKEARLTLNGCLPDHCAGIQRSSRLCGCIQALPCSTLTFFIQTTSLPLPGKCTPPFSARSDGTTRAWSVFYPTKHWWEACRWFSWCDRGPGSVNVPAGVPLHSLSLI